MTTRWLTGVLLGTLLALAPACGKDKDGDSAKAKAKADPPAEQQGKVSANNLPPAPAGARRIPIEVKRAGYVPNKVEAKAGEDLVLVFTRTEEGSCGEQIQVQGTELKASLPLN